MSEDTEATPAPAKQAKGKAQPKKAKGAGKGAKGAKGEPKGGASGGAVMSVASHPRARGHIRQAKGWGGLLAFGITAYLSLSHGVTPDVAGLRAIGAGVAGYVVAWACALMVWRQLMVAELRARVERARRSLEEPAESAAEQPAKS